MPPEGERIRGTRCLTIDVPGRIPDSRTRSQKATSTVPAYDTWHASQIPSMSVGCRWIGPASAPVTRGWMTRLARAAGRRINP